MTHPASLRRRLAAAAVVVGTVAPAAFATPFVHTPVPTATGGSAGAATVDSVATDVAIATLRRGGNAVDATVAAAGVLGVTEPFSAGIGGGGFMVIRTSDGEVTTIDSRETAPAAMQPDSFFIDGQPPTAAQFNVNRYSGLSVGVPGTVAGWDLALRRYGTWSLRRALRPGIRVAREGFVVDQTFVAQTEPNVDYFNDIPSTAAIYLERDGTAYDVGDVVRNPDLARTYQRIADRGARDFYRGPIARAVAEASEAPPVAADANHTWRPGLMSRRDLRRYRAAEREPTHVDYRGLDVWSMGPPSSGGSTVGEALNILAGDTDPGADAGLAYHRYLEASRLAFADRNAFLGDPAFTTVPLCGLLSTSFADERRRLISDRAATSPVAAGDPTDNCDEGGVGVSSEEGPGGTETTHLTVADADGNVVSYTFTIESTGGSGIVVPGWGFLLNNELTDFDIDKVDHPNSPAGGKRPRSSMAPTIVTRDGEPLLALGSPGGSTIITTVLQVLIERLDLGRDLPGAIAAPRASQRNGATTQVEPSFRAAQGPGLEARGHAFSDTNEIGAATGIEFAPSGVVAAAEPTRRGGGNAQTIPGGGS